MQVCRKRVCLVIAVFLIVCCLSCARKTQEHAVSSTAAAPLQCSIQTVSEGSALQVLLDDKAKAMLVAQKIDAVYCMPMGST